MGVVLNYLDCVVRKERLLRQTGLREPMMNIFPDLNANQWIDDVQQQGELHLLLPDNSGKRIVSTMSFCHGYTDYLISISM